MYFCTKNLKEIVFVEQTETVKRIYKVTSRKSSLFKRFKPSKMREANLEILKDVVDSI